MPGQIWRLNNPVETRRPFFLMCWISRLRFKKNGTTPCPAVMTNLPVGYPSRSHPNSQRFVRSAGASSILSIWPRQDDSTHPRSIIHHPDVCLHADCLGGRKVSDGETSTTFGSATSDNFSAVLCTHALPKSMFPLALEIRGLLKSERHCALLLERSFFNEEAAL